MNKSIAYYQAMGYERLNGILRKNNIPIMRYPPSDKELLHIYNLDTIIKKSGPKPGTLVYRGVSLPEISPIDHGFVSCSLSKDIAIRFSSRYYKCCLLEFILPNNINAWISPNAERVLQNPDLVKSVRITTEGEVILQRNIEFYDIEDTHETYDDIRVFRCKVRPIPWSVEEINEDNDDDEGGSWSMTSSYKTSPKKVKTSPKKVKTSPKKVKTSPKKVKTSPKKVKTSPKRY
jgi:hypothetical protein